MEGKLVDKIPLDNGLTLEIYDRSRPVAGDRWLVVLWICVEITVSPDYFEGEDSEGPSFDAVRDAVGDRVTYTYEKTRNFIAETDKAEAFEGLKERFLEATVPYLSTTKFPRNMILSKFKEG